jgi:hypothetical protein
MMMNAKDLLGLTLDVVDRMTLAARAVSDGGQKKKKSICKDRLDIEKFRSSGLRLASSSDTFDDIRIISI